MVKALHEPAFMLNVRQPGRKVSTVRDVTVPSVDHVHQVDAELQHRHPDGVTRGVTIGTEMHVVTFNNPSQETEHGRLFDVVVSMAGKQLRGQLIASSDGLLTTLRFLD